MQTEVGSRRQSAGPAIHFKGLHYITAVGLMRLILLVEVRGCIAAVKQADMFTQHSLFHLHSPPQQQKSNIIGGGIQIQTCSSWNELWILKGAMLLPVCAERVRKTWKNCLNTWKQFSFTEAVQQFLSTLQSWMFRWLQGCDRWRKSR